MRSDIKEIENILQCGNKILKNRPELYDMSLDEVIDELDDGANEMISYRWGVAARIVVNAIKSWDIRSLVEYLAKINSGLLTYEYVGYILLKEYHIDLEQLIIEAQSYNLFDEIVKYVCANMRFIPKPRRFADVIEVLDKNSEFSNYDDFIWNYALAIAESNAFLEVENELIEIKNQTQYKLSINLSKNWYIKDITTAKLYIEHLLECNSVWSKKAAIQYWNVGLYYDVSIFSKYFSRFECLLQNKEYWILIIPVFVNYLYLITNEDKTSVVYKNVIDLLNRIPKSSLEVKRAFFSAIRFQNDILGDIRKIMDDILAVPFDKDNQTLDLIDSIISRHIKHGQVFDAIQQLLHIFSVNKYRLDYYGFFENLDSSLFELSKHSVETTEISLSYMLSNNVDKMLFGLGLLLNAGNIDKFKESKLLIQKNCKMYTEKEIICIMKSISILSFDCNQICSFAFKLSEILAGNHDKYLEFCINEIYYNFPFTMRRLSDKYKDSKNEFQMFLSQKVVELHQTYLNEQNVAKEIKDLHPYLEHLVTINKAFNKQNEQINKQAMSQSFFADIFPVQRLKYGVNVGHINRLQKKDKAYSASPLQHMQHESELPVSYIIDPVDYEYKRRAYLKEVGRNEIDY